MCGIFALFGVDNDFDPKDKKLIQNAFMKGRHRGPENSQFQEISDYLLFGFHRLAINGLDNISNQPIYKDGCFLICNGEIYNHKELENEFGYKMNTHSDCEVIIDLYKEYGFENMLNMIDGVFGMILFDKDLDTAFIARDPFGVRPLFIGFHNRIFENLDDFEETPYDNYPLKENKLLLGFASEMKQLTDFNFDKIQQIKPGTYTTLRYQYINKKQYDTRKLFLIRNFDEFEKPYFKLPTLRMNYLERTKNDIYKMMLRIGHSFFEAVKKRVWNTDRPIACLLSGGLDSSLVCAVVNYYLKLKGDKHRLETYSIGLDGSVDLQYAKKVADWINSNHTEIKVQETEFLDAIENVIYIIESYDTTTVRASVGNFLVSKYISEHSDAKVIFNGDGADELMGGYLYFHKAPNAIEFDMECKRLLENIHFFDVLRSDRSISSNGLEARTPFLDKNFVCDYLMLPPDIRMIKEGEMEKQFIREAVSLYWSDVLKMDNLIFPKEVLWRTKEAFSDGVSNQKRSWFQIIQEWVEKKEYLEFENFDGLYNEPTTLEQKYYRYIFNKFFTPKNSDNDYAKVIPYFWMPKWVNATDASARTLDVYKQKIKDDDGDHHGDHHEHHKDEHDDQHNEASTLDGVV